MELKERATVTLTSATLRAARELIPDLNLSAICDKALYEALQVAEHAKIAASYAEFPSDFDDTIDWAARYGMSTAEEQKLLGARKAWSDEE
jgi:hypothetical protein